MKKRLSWMLIVVMLFSTLSGISSPSFAYTGNWQDGIVATTETWDSGGVIGSAAELSQFCYNVNNGLTYSGQTITLTGNIDLTDHEWTPIGTVGNPFSGTFDGGGYTVSNMSIATNNTANGFFGVADGATIQNLTVHGSITVGGSNHTGGILATSNIAMTTIQNCHSDVTINVLTGGVGGLIGYGENNCITISNSYNTGNITATNNGIGGIGGVVRGPITNCYNSGDISGNDHVGGIAGQADSALAVYTNLYSIGNVSGHDNIGSIAGLNGGTLSHIVALNQTMNQTANNSYGRVANNADNETFLYAWDGLLVDGNPVISVDATSKEGANVTRVAVNAEANWTTWFTDYATYWEMEAGELPNLKAFASDGLTMPAYLVPATDASLSALTISDGTIDPVFDAGTNSYTASVDNDVTTITVTPTVNDSNATVTVNGVGVTSGNASGNISLDVGVNTLTVIGTAEDTTTTETYTIEVTREAPALTYDASSFIEANANDGSIVTTITGTLIGDTFVVSGGVMAENTDYTVANVPAGLTVVVTGTSATTATVALTGNATSHLDADDISNLTLTFLDAGLGSASAAGLTGASKTNFAVDYKDPYALSYSGSIFNEVPANDGSISEVLTVTLTSDTFVVSDAAMILDTHYSVANVPAGLTVVVTGTSETTATIGLSGNAAAHRSSDDVANMTINFLDDAFVISSAAEVLNTEKADYNISYLNPEIEYSSFEFLEAVANDGSINNTLTLTLSGDTFVVSGGVMVENTDYTIANVPAGLTAVLRGTSATTATLELTGNAASHDSASSISNLTLTLLDAAFTNGTASDISNYERSNLEISYEDAFADIVFYEGTHIQYDEADGTPVYVAPNAEATDKSKYLEFSIAGSTTNETLALHTVANADTSNGAVSVVGKYIYLGDGTKADVIGGIDLVKDGQNGNALKVIFSESIPNGAFTADGLVSNGNPISNWVVTAGSITLGAEAEYTQGRAITSSGSGPYTIALDIDPSDASYYSFTSDFDYDGSIRTAWGNEALELPSGTVSTTTIVEADASAVGGYALKLTSSGSVSSQADIYGSHFGPQIVSETFEATAGTKLSLDWKASDQADHYEVYGFLLKMDGAASETVLSQEIIFYGRGQLQGWTQAEGIIPEDGYYRFRFVNGTYDKTGGNAVGSYLWIDNIRVLGDSYQSKEVIQQLARLVTYESTEPDPSNTRTLSFSVHDELDNVTTQTATIHINNQYNHPPTLSLGTSTPVYGINTNTAVSLFDSANTSTIEAGEAITGFKLEIATVLDGASETLEVDHESISLTDGNSGSTNLFSYSVSDTAGTVTITFTGGVASEAEMNTLFNSIKYNNSNALAVAGNRTVKVIELTDNGGVSNGGTDTSTLNISSQITIKATVDDFALSSKGTSTAGFTWTAPPDATALQIEISTDGGNTWSNATHDPLLVTDISGDVTDLTPNSIYHFRLNVTGGSEAGYSNVLEVKTNAVVTSTPEPELEPEPDIVNTNFGEKESDLSFVESDVVSDDGNSTVNLTFNESKFDEAFESIESTEEAVLTIKVATGTVEATKVSATIDSNIIDRIKEKEITLKFETDYGSYAVPYDELDLEAFSKEYGEDVAKEAVSIQIDIEETSQAKSEQLKEVIENSGYTAIGKPLTFSVKTIYQNEQKEVEKFNQYVTREILIPDGIDPNNITTAVTFKADGTMLHIPTYIVEADGRYYAKINSLTNSIYTLIYNKKIYYDTVDHWAYETITDMASRLVINGATEDVFNPDEMITRGEFISIVTKALGILDIRETGTFVDLSKEMAYFNEIQTAVTYNLIAGYGKNDIKSEQLITREEAFVVMNHAALIANTKLKNTVDFVVLESYIDLDQLSDWAKASAAFCIENELITGYNNQLLSKQTLSRAEAAQMVRNMLMVPNLIEYRTIE